MVSNSVELLFETPKDKMRVFQSPSLVMISERGDVLRRWSNTQPLYFYPFSWLDYLNGKGVRELYVVNSSTASAKKVIGLLNKGKVHFESFDAEAVVAAKEAGHKVSVICDSEDLVSEHVPILARADFVRVRAGKGNDLRKLSGLPSRNVLTCVKVYLGEGGDYLDLANQARDAGFDFIHVAKRLADGRNKRLTVKERREVMKLKDFESDRLRIILPSSLEWVCAERFGIDSGFSNDRQCSFSDYRAVVSRDAFYPCYTRAVLARGRFARQTLEPETHKRECGDCACIYENDMLADIRRKRAKFKNIRFALEYVKNDR